METTIRYDKKTKTEFKRDSLTRIHQFNNILVYYMAYFFDVYAKKYYKSANKIVPFLLVSHIVHQGEEIYSYNPQTKILKYKIPGSNENEEEMVVYDVENLDSDIHRRQMNILIVFALKMGLRIKYSKANTKKSPIPKWNIIMIDFHDHNNEQHIITTDNLNEYYDDIKKELANQMERVTNPDRVFLVSNPEFVYQPHSILMIPIPDSQSNESK